MNLRRTKARYKKYMEKERRKLFAWYFSDSIQVIGDFSIPLLWIGFYSASGEFNINKNGRKRQKLQYLSYVEVKTCLQDGGVIWDLIDLKKQWGTDKGKCNVKHLSYLECGIKHTGREVPLKAVICEVDYKFFKM